MTIDRITHLNVEAARLALREALKPPKVEDEIERLFERRQREGLKPDEEARLQSLNELKNKA